MLCLNQGSTFIVTTLAGGDCKYLKSNMRSNWAGAMYPPGYKIVNNNISYVEGEDELDDDTANGTKVKNEISSSFNKSCDNYNTKLGLGIDDTIIDDTVTSGMREVLEIDKFDPLLEEALRISEAEGQIVDVIGDMRSDSSIRDDHYHQKLELAQHCQPEPYLRFMVNGDDEEDATARDNTRRTRNGKGGNPLIDILCKLPNRDEAMNTMESALRKASDCHALRDLDITIKKMTTSSSSRKIKSKHAASVDAMINAACNPALRVASLKHEAPADGSGSSLSLLDFNSNDSCLSSQCAACMGRMVIHSCGKRALPVDLQAIADKRKEEEQKDIEAKREKRRIADTKRRELKRKLVADEKRKAEASTLAEEMADMVDHNKKFDSINDHSVINDGVIMKNDCLEQPENINSVHQLENQRKERDNELDEKENWKEQEEETHHEQESSQTQFSGTDYEVASWMTEIKDVPFSHLK